jgi:hypothetical protein
MYDSSHWRYLIPCLLMTLMLLLLMLMPWMMLMPST